ncbi:MAG: hypothetical protein A4C66_10730 [Nitrospira sp. HN-bin3]|uniref:hypothetical protein n=1 Tax=Nitrospira cf. moscoviensis SBR1015 TaxID=96242 RepID=UPI000A0AFF6C|nr:hypothetical protein [Nitrospira cf. moscoviensis SBR1015]OQW40301.1 MAG: hypothetical protein A4C66_10730 [Nitrospira sp. HN-bin3]
MKLNWKKILLFSVVSSFAPAMANWANSVQTGQDIPFTVGNIVVPAIPTLITTLAALFSNPRQKE